MSSVMKIDELNEELRWEYDKETGVVSCGLAKAVVPYGVWGIDSPGWFFHDDESNSDIGVQFRFFTKLQGKKPVMEDFMGREFEALVGSNDGPHAEYGERDGVKYFIKRTAFSYDPSKLDIMPDEVKAMMTEEYVPYSLYGVYEHPQGVFTVDVSGDSKFIDEDMMRDIEDIIASIEFTV